MAVGHPFLFRSIIFINSALPLPVHPQLQFISHLPSTVLGEQLISQLFRSIPNQQWLFRYGRVPLNFLLSEYVWKVCLVVLECCI